TVTSSAYPVLPVPPASSSRSLCAVASVRNMPAASELPRKFLLCMIKTPRNSHSSRMRGYASFSARDHAILVVLLGCGLRRSEVAAVAIRTRTTAQHRWCIVDLVGKHNHVRTIPMPTWVKVAIDAWTSAAGLADGRVFRPENRGDKVRGEAMSEKVVWQMLRLYATNAGVPGIAPHDCRRSCAKLCRAAGGELEQIQLLLGHASVQTTERYL